MVKSPPGYQISWHRGHHQKYQRIVDPSSFLSEIDTMLSIRSDKECYSIRVRNLQILVDLKNHRHEDCKWLWMKTCSTYESYFHPRTFCMADDVHVWMDWQSVQKFRSLNYPCLQKDIDYLLMINSTSITSFCKPGVLGFNFGMQGMQFTATSTLRKIKRFHSRCMSIVFQTIMTTRNVSMGCNARRWWREKYW